jgi:hypothetical protein
VVKAVLSVFSVVLCREGLQFQRRAHF